MGDNIGMRMGLLAVAWWASHNEKPTQAQALEALDAICMPYREQDVEFDAIDPNNPHQMHPDYNEYTDPKGPVGRLIAIAFHAKSHEMYLIGNGGECPWFDGPFTRFAERYGFT